MNDDQRAPSAEQGPRGRPAFIPRDQFRQWMTTTGLKKILQVDGITPAGYVGRCARAGRPIRSRGTLYRPLDVVARARAEGLSVTPPKLTQMRERADELKASIAELEREYRDLQGRVAHKIEMSQLSEGLTNLVLLTEQEIVDASEPQPSITGVYFLVKGRRVVYAGQSTNVLARIAAHGRDKDFDRFAFVPCERAQLDMLESMYIHCLRPELNGRLNGDNGHHAPLSLVKLAGIKAGRNLPAENHDEKESSQ